MTILRIHLDWRFVAQLGWVALFAALAVAAMLGTELAISDLGGDQAKPQQEALASVVSLAMLLGLVAAVSATLVFAPAQLLQAAVRLRFGILLSLATIPAGALLTWFCFDRILPLDVNLGFNGLPARSGPQPLEWQSYLTALGFQAVVSAISLSRHLKRGRTALLLVLAGAALVFGVIWGHAMADLHPPA